jgi:hypothetical protein
MSEEVSKDVVFEGLLRCDRGEREREREKEGTNNKTKKPKDS